MLVAAGLGPRSENYCPKRKPMKLVLIAIFFYS